MLKKMTVLAMAVGVVAAVVLPASASANWKHHATNLQVNKTINFTGNARFEGALGGIECQLTSGLLFEPGTTGKVETFDVHPQDETTNCDGFGALDPCQVHDQTPQTGLNWVFHTVTIDGIPKIKVTTGELTAQLTGGIFCIIKHLRLTPTDEAKEHFVTLLPNQTNTITGGQIHGELEADQQTNNGNVHKETVEVSGSFTIENAADKHTYSI